MFLVFRLQTSSPNLNYLIIPLLVFCRRLQAIEADRLPQVLAIQHSDEDKERDYDEGEDDFCSIGADSTDEEDEEKCCDSQSTASPDSSLQSLSPGDLSLNEQPYCETKREINDRPVVYKQ